MRRALALIAAALTPVPVFAHAFGQQYTLPLPVSLYILGAGAAVLASFLILSLFANPHSTSRGEHAYVLSSGVIRLISLLRSFALLLLAIAVLTGLFGSQEATKNPSLFLYWVGLLLIMVYVSAIVSGLWERIDPFRAIVGPFFGPRYQPLAAFPPFLRYIPALIFYYWLLWFELLSFGAGALPQNVALALISYVVIAYFGAGIFGSEAWFRYGDFFSVFFRTVGKFAPLSIEESRLVRRAPGARLIEEVPDGPALLVFVLLVLSSTAFDGLRDTLPWVRFFSAHPALETQYGLLVIAILLASPFVFFAFFWIATALMRIITGKSGLLMRFAYSLVPIAIAYNVAHYFSLLVSEGQNLIPMLSDPLGRGWDLVGTAAYQYNPALLSAKAVWYTQVAAIVLGHIIATYIAHRIAQRSFDTRRQVILSQVPMVALMILYTGFGLWILSLPYAT